MSTTATPGAPADEVVPFEVWLATVAASDRLTNRGRDVVQLLHRRPRIGAFGSTREIAELAEVNLGTVTRAAQSLGYDGWTEFQREFRTRYLASLSATEVAHEHQRSDSSAASSLAKDRADLALVAKTIAPDVPRRIAARIAAASRTLVLAQGSYAAVGTALAHNAGLIGHDVRLVTEPAALANAIARLSPGDLFVAVNSWRIYVSTAQALRAVADLGVESVVVTDSASPSLEALATWHIPVPSEGVGFFPSLVAAMSVVQAIVVELAALDPDRSSTELQRSEHQWQHFGLLQQRGS